MKKFTKTMVAATVALACVHLPSFASEPADLMIKNAQILPMDGQQRIIDDGVIVVKGNRIIAIGSMALEQQYQAARTIDAGGDIVMPGMINTHNHIPMVAFRGLGENGVENRLINFMFPLEKEMLSRELIRTASRHAAMELALSGVTLITDMYYHEDEVAKSVAEVGIRGVLGETVIGFPVVDAKQPYGGLEYAEKFIDEWQGHPLITPAVAPHAPYTVSAEWLIKAKDLAVEKQVPLLTHLAEFTWEDAKTDAFSDQMSKDQSVVEYLDSIGFLVDNLVAAHVNHLDEEDMDLLKKHGVGIAHNPKANTKGNNGYSPSWDMVNKGLDVGLGTDGPMSSNQMDIINVMGYAAVVARTNHGDNAKFTPYELVELATIGGARVLDMDDEIGSLEVGKKADIVIVDTDAPNTQPNYDPFATLAFSAYPQNVTHTIVDGQVIVADGKLTTVSQQAHDKEWVPVTKKVGDFAKTLN